MVETTKKKINKCKTTETKIITPFCICCSRATTAIVPSTRFSPIISELAGTILTATGFFFRLSMVVSNSTTSIIFHLN